MLFQSENYQYMEQVASQCCGGFLRQLLQETTGLTGARMWNNDAYIHYYYKLQVTSYVITAETDRERILKIGQHLPKLWERIKFPVFFHSLDRLHEIDMVHFGNSTSLITRRMC